MNPYAEIETFLNTYLIPNGPWLDIPLAAEYRAFTEKLLAYDWGRDSWLYRDRYGDRLKELKGHLLDTAFRLAGQKDAELVNEALKTIQQSAPQSRLAELVPLWTRLLQMSDSEIKTRAGQILIQSGTPEALQALTQHWLDAEPIEWRRTLFVNMALEPLRKFLLGQLRVNMSMKLLKLLEPLLPAYQSWNHEYVERYRGPSDDEWDQQVSQWLETSDPRQVLYHQVVGRFVRHANQAYLNRHRGIWNEWILSTDPDFYKPAVLALVRLLDSGDSNSAEVLTAALVSPAAHASRSQVFALLAPRVFSVKKELWLRLLASYDESLKRQAQEACLMPIFAGMDLEFWELLWRRGETDALRLRGACELYLRNQKEVFIWLIEYMPAARGGELKRIWKTFLKRPSRHTTLYAVELLTSKRYAKHKQLRREAARALGRLTPCPESSQALLHALKDSDLDLQSIAALSLASQTAPPKKLVSWCEEGLASSEIRFIMTALKIADKLHFVSLKPAIEALVLHANKQIRRKATSALMSKAFWWSEDAQAL